MNPGAVEAAILERKTLKVLGSEENKAVLAPEAAARNNEIVLESLRISGYAPFHYARNSDEIAEPWRAYVLWHQECQSLAPKLFEWDPELQPENKIPQFLYACGALVLVTWLPEFYHLEDKKPGQLMIDEEHLAASSAMVQNLLLLLTSHGMGTYWSSGGILRKDNFLKNMGIPTEERLLAAVFVEYPETLDEPRFRKPGKHRDSRSEDSRWVKLWDEGSAGWVQGLSR